MSKRKANWLERKILVVRTGLSTLYSSLCAIFGSLQRDPLKRRAYIDALVRRWSARLLSHVGLSHSVVGAEHVHLEPGKSYIVMCNHASHYDIPVSFMALPGSMRMLAKKELFKIPLFGTAMTRAEFIQVDRDDPEQARRDLQSARQKLESGIILWIAPEGTRSKTGKLLPLKKGGFHLAITMGATIIPVGIRGIAEVLPPNERDYYLDHHCEVHIGEMIDASQYGLDQRQQLINRVVDALRTLAGQEQ